MTVPKRICLVGFIVLVLLTLRLAPSWGFGDEGHQIIGAIAEARLKDTNALKKVHEILGGKSMADAALWADTIKKGPIRGDRDSKRYLRANPTHKEYHYVDLPFQVGEYSLGTTGTREDDVVQLSRLCIRHLEGNGGDNPHHLNDRIAMLLLIHYIGDMHQPLHVGSGYLNNHNAFVDPNSVPHTQHDRGGNALKWHDTDMHTFFDVKAVTLAMQKANAADWEDYATELAKREPQDNWQLSGKPENWPKQLAEDALPLSNNVYTKIKTVEPGNRAGEWKVDVSEGFEENAAKMTDQQLAKGGYRLAELLKAIWPQ